MVAMERRPGRERKVYLRPEVDGAFDAYREDVQDRTGVLPAANAVLLGLVEAFLIQEGYLLPRKMKGSQPTSHKER